MMSEGIFLCNFLICMYFKILETRAVKLIALMQTMIRIKNVNTVKNEHLTHFLITASHCLEVKCYTCCVTC